MPESRPSLEMIAPTVDEAVARGAAAFGVTADRLLVEVLDEGGQGMLGMGSRQARVRLTLLGGAAAPAPATAVADDEADEEDEEHVAREIEVARETVRELVSLMGLTARVSGRWGDADEPEEPRPILVDIQGDDLSLLIGRRGENARWVLGMHLGRHSSKGDNSLHTELPCIFD
jgi:spoIIIJ-associated protein